MLKKRVCTGEWKWKLLFQEKKNTWTCYEQNRVMLLVWDFCLWAPVDEGLVEARRGQWHKLTQRLERIAEQYLN